MSEAEKTHSCKKETALTQPRVVIVGGGFGGLCAARGLAGAPVSVTLIRQAQLPSLPSHALPGGDRLVIGRPNVRAAAIGPEATGQCGGAGGRGARGTDGPGR